LVTDLPALDKPVDQGTPAQRPYLVVGDIKDAAELADPVDLQGCGSLERRPAVADKIGQIAFNDRLDAVIVVDAAVRKDNPGAECIQLNRRQSWSFRPALETSRRQLQQEWREHRRKCRRGGDRVRDRDGRMIDMADDI